MPQVDGERSVFEAQRWGLPATAVDEVASRLRRVWARYQHCFRTKTRDSAGHAWSYLQGLLSMTADRNYANIARRVVDVDDDGQKLQHFISDSPWSAQAVFDQIQGEIRERPELQDGMLTLDESGTKRAGEYSAGATQQYIGRERSVAMGQVGVALGYYGAGAWAMVDAELYLPRKWHDDGHADLRRRWHIPAERSFARKSKLGMEMIKRAKANELPFAMVACDSFYGQDFAFRADLDAQGLLYMAEIVSDMYVWLHPPRIGEPEPPTGKRGRPPSREQVLNKQDLVQVRDLRAHPDWALQRVDVRHTERGLLRYRCTAHRVWMVRDGRMREEWLFLHHEGGPKFSYFMSNAPAATPLEQLALWRSQRYFAERTFQDAKSEAGWDELVARKYRAWIHHTALTALALWFVAETKLDWLHQHPRDPSLAGELGVEALPMFSMANVRELLVAAMPLQRLSQADAMRLVTKHLVQRSRSTASRLRAQARERASP